VLQEANLAWLGGRVFRSGLATNLCRLGVSDKVIQQILRHANVSTTMNIYVKTVSADAASAMESSALNLHSASMGLSQQNPV